MDVENKTGILFFFFSVKRLPRYDSCFYLFVDSRHNGRSDFHSQHKALLEVLLQEQRLQESHHEQQHGVQVALPVVAELVLSEGDRESEQENRWYLSEPRFMLLFQAESCLYFSFPHCSPSDTGCICAEQ